MLRSLVKIFRKNFGAIKKSLQMAENTELLNAGEKRGAEVTGLNQQKAKKKKKEHIVTLGGSEGFKRKLALLVAYNGAGYYGVQINRGFKTIESEIFKALVETGAVPQAHSDDTSKMWFQRGSRTDKGVSAVGQVFSLKMVIVPDVVSKLNENLPPEIRVLGYIRTTNGFDSKNFCCGRTYMYMTPTFAFAPLEKFITVDEYRITDDRLEQVREILKKYVGTHKFHNFTSGVKFEQACAFRYIISFECSDPYVRDGIEFVTLRVRGQSFMLHQIRKMIGLMMAILRGYCGESALTKSWEAERVDIPKAPGLGLVLEALHFDGYNKKFGKDGVHEPIDWSPHQATMDEFKEKYVISDIVQQEKKDKVMLNWLQTLQFHNFDQARPEGPQKPWVKTIKLLKESKECEPNLGTEDVVVETEDGASEQGPENKSNLQEVESISSENLLTPDNAPDIESSTGSVQNISERLKEHGDEVPSVNPETTTTNEAAEKDDSSPTSENLQTESRSMDENKPTDNEENERACS